MMIAQIVFVSPRAWNSIYRGTVRSATGSSSPPMIIPTAIFLPGNANFAIAYPAMTATSVPTAPAVTEYRTELATHRQNRSWVQAMRRSEERRVGKEVRARWWAEVCREQQQVDGECRER